jgi:hypothetical protein
MSDMKLFGLVCPTLCQGLTISLGDIYLTKEAAEAEHADMRRMRAAAIAAGDIDDEDEDDDGFEVMEIVVKSDGSIVDTFDAPITVTDTEDKADVLQAVADLIQPPSGPRESA